MASKCPKRPQARAREGKTWIGERVALILDQSGIPRFRWNQDDWLGLGRALQWAVVLHWCASCTLQAVVVHIYLQSLLRAFLREGTPQATTKVISNMAGQGPACLAGKRIAVVGSGITGLSAAWLCHRWARPCRKCAGSPCTQPWSAPSSVGLQERSQGHTV
jgi:hypothetical protein